MYNGGFPEYVPVWKRREQAQKKIDQLRKKGRTVTPIVIEGRKITKTFWGQSWCRHLEEYSDFASRLPRGRTYARNGSVIDLQIDTGKLRALVSGTGIYDISIDIKPLEKDRWRKLVRQCSGRIDSVVELLSGKLSDGVMEVLCQQHAGLFPSSNEIALSCSCPDSAWLCKHLAAVLYGVGARLDHAPELLFVLRGVDQLDLVSQAGGAGLHRKNSVKAQRLDDDTLSDIFGIELDAGSAPPAPRGARAKRKRSSTASAPPRRKRAAKPRI